MRCQCKADATHAGKYHKLLYPVYPVMSSETFRDAWLQFDRPGNTE